MPVAAMLLIQRVMTANRITVAAMNFSESEYESAVVFKSSHDQSVSTLHHAVVSVSSIELTDALRKASARGAIHGFRGHILSACSCVNSCVIPTSFPAALCDMTC